MKKYYSLLLIITVLIISPSSAQLVVTPNSNATQLLQTLLGGGVTASNAVITGAAAASGTFTANSTNLGINAGILLTSGFATNAVGPNFSPGITGANGTPGDPLLNFAGTTFDANRLEFDFVPCSDTIRFKYVFGSDEYTEFVNGGYNDVFGFFISGPGYPVPTNIALIPGTSTPVSIDNVNCLGANTTYYVCNEPTGGSGCNAATCAPVTTIEYDGFTVVLTAIAVVQSGQTYHLILAVADAGDGVLDSGVFLEAGSLTSAGISATVVSPYVDPATNSPIGVEGCINPSLHFQLNMDTITNDTLCFPILYAGNAIPGIDYVPLPDTICFYPGDTAYDLVILVLQDAISETLDTLNIIPQIPGLCGLTGIGVQVFIADNVIVQAGADTTICNGGQAHLSVNLGPNLNWTPTSTLSCNNCTNPIATPNITTTYTVTMNIAGCSGSDQVTVTVSNPLPVTASGGGSICAGDSIQISASGAGITQYSWSPANTVSPATAANAWAFPVNTQIYTVNGTSACGTTTDTVWVIVHPQPVANAFPNTSICPGESVQLNATGGINYFWLTPLHLSNALIPNPIATPTNSPETFIVVAQNGFGCYDTATVTINFHPVPDADAGISVLILLGDSVQLNATGGNTYSWSPQEGLSNPYISNPIASPTHTTTYTVTVTSIFGCSSADTMTVRVKDDPAVYLPNAFSPNGDGVNDLLHIIHYGIFNLSSFKVYNRWGQLVFESSDINRGWDGTYKEVNQEQEVYIWYIAGTGFEGKNVFLQGNVTLIR